MQDLLAQLQVLLDDTLSYVIYLAIVWASLQIKKYIGIQIDQKAQNDLHRAALTAARAAIARGLDQTKAMTHIEAYIDMSVPGAIKRLAPPPPVLHEIIKSKLEEAKLAA